MRKIWLVAVMVPFVLCFTQCRSLKKSSVSDVTAVATAADSVSAQSDSIVRSHVSGHDETMSITAGRRRRIEFLGGGGEVYIGADGSAVLRGVSSADMENIEVSVGSHSGSEQEERVETHSGLRSAGTSEVHVERHEEERSERLPEQTVFGSWMLFVAVTVVFLLTACIWRRLRR